MIGQELQALIKYIQLNKASDSDWFTITSNKEGTHWSGKCWYVHELIKYEFDFEFDIPATYPATAPEIRIPSLGRQDGQDVPRGRHMPHGALQAAVGQEQVGRALCCSFSCGILLPYIGNDTEHIPSYKDSAWQH